jgi:hypothetical protein
VSLSAELYGVELPVRVTGLDPELRVELPRSRFVIGRIEGCDLVIEALVGGRRGYGIGYHDQCWYFEHYGHVVPYLVNQREYFTSGDVLLEDGDVVEILLADPDPRGPRLLFLEPSPFPGRTPVLTATAQALGEAFPGRAARILREVASWFHTESLPPRPTLARIGACSLCARFHRVDWLAMQVSGGFRRRAPGPVATKARRVARGPAFGRLLAEPKPDPKDGARVVCSNCAATPGAGVHAEAALADCARAPIDPPLLLELERRLLHCRPRLVPGLCDACGDAGEVLKGWRAAYCRGCLDLASRGAVARAIPRPET